MRGRRHPQPSFRRPPRPGSPWDLETIPKQHPDGVSLVPLLQGDQELSRDAIYWHYPHYGNQGGSPGSAIRSGNYKLIEYFENGHLELYDLSKDIGESENLIKTRPEIADSLYEQLKQWRLEVEARYPSDNPAFQPE